MPKYLEPSVLSRAEALGIKDRETKDFDFLLGLRVGVGISFFNQLASIFLV